MEWVEGEGTKWIDAGEIQALELVKEEEPEQDLKEEKGGKKAKKDNKKKSNLIEWEEGKVYNGFFEHDEEDLYIGDSFVKTLCGQRLKFMFYDSLEKKSIFEKSIDFSSLIVAEATEDNLYVPTIIVNNHLV